MREAIVTLSDSELEAIGFDGLVSLCREAGIRDVEMLEDKGYTCIPQVEVEEQLDPNELDELACIDQWELVTEKDDTYLYLLELTATELPRSTTDDHDALIGNCDTTMTDRGVLLSLIGSQEAIRDMLRNYEGAGVTPDLCKLTQYEGEENMLDALTDRQLEVIETAYKMGFYDLPREASTEDIGGELDIDAATVSEHLQRAERNLLTQQLST